MTPQALAYLAAGIGAGGATLFGLVVTIILAFK